jgi:hypothetical protein
VYIFLFHVDFVLEDIMVSRSLRQAIDPTNPELPDTPVIGALSNLTQSSLHVPDNEELSVPTATGAFSKLQQSTLIETENTDVSVPISPGAFSKLQLSSLNEPENKEVSAPTAARAFRKLEQSSLYDLENREGSVPTAAGALCQLGKLSPYHTENKEVSGPTTAGTDSRLGQSSLHDPENQEMSVPSAASVVRKPSIIDSFKSFFRVKKKVNEIKISVTQEEFLRKSWKVGKKKLHRRKIVPVIIWDFGGQNVFYSTHQTFLTYRAIYMLVLDGSRTLDERCPFEQYLPGKGGDKTQRGRSLFLYI